MPLQGWIWGGLTGCAILAVILSQPPWLYAQQALPTCEQLRVEADFKLNAEALQNRTLRDAFARELRVAVERAEKAETALKLAQQELVKGHGAAQSAQVPEKPKE